MSILTVKNAIPELPKSRLPKYGGQIIIDGKQGGDFGLPHVLLSDAVAFLGQSNPSCHRAAIFSAFACFEAFLNQLAFMQCHHDVDKLGVIERDVMEEMRSKLDERTGEIVRVKQNYGVDERFLFLYAYYRQERFDKSGSMWCKFTEAKKLRDRWTHPKPPFDASGPSAEEATLVVESIGEMLRSLMRLPYDWMWPFGPPNVAVGG